MALPPGGSRCGPRLDPAAQIDGDDVAGGHVAGLARSTAADSQVASRLAMKLKSMVRRVGFAPRPMRPVSREIGAQLTRVTWPILRPGRASPLP